MTRNITSFHYTNPVYNLVTPCDMKNTSLKGFIALTVFTFFHRCKKPFDPMLTKLLLTPVLHVELNIWTSRLSLVLFRLYCNTKPQQPWKSSAWSRQLQLIAAQHRLYMLLVKGCFYPSMNCIFHLFLLKYKIIKCGKYGIEKKEFFVSFCLFFLTFMSYLWFLSVFSFFYIIINSILNN